MVLTRAGKSLEFPELLDMCLYAPMCVLDHRTSFRNFQMSGTAAQQIFCSADLQLSGISAQHPVLVGTSSP